MQWKILQTLFLHWSIFPVKKSHEKKHQAKKDWTDSKQCQMSISKKNCPVKGHSIRYLSLRGLLPFYDPYPPYPPPLTRYIQYTYSHREGGGGELTREKVRGAVSPVYKLYKRPVKTTIWVWRLYSSLPMTPGIRKIHQSNNVICKVLRKNWRQNLQQGSYVSIWSPFFGLDINMRKVLFLYFPARWRRWRIFAFFCFSPPCSSDATLRRIWELCQEKK